MSPTLLKPHRGAWYELPLPAPCSRSAAWEGDSPWPLEISSVACSCNSGRQKGVASWLKEICLADLIWKCKLMMSQRPGRTAGRVILETSWCSVKRPSKPKYQCKIKCGFGLIFPKICVAGHTLCVPSILCLRYIPGIPDQL